MDYTKEIYTRLLQVIPNLRNIGNYAKLSASGFMDLHVDILHKKGNVWRISLAHNYRAGGDVIPDPDMEVTVDFVHGTAQAETYQDTYVYREATDETSRKELNEFLVLWLGNLVEQGHKIEDSSSNQ
jgi:uncharacterized protein YqiB (DUF1249 family)